MTSTLYSIIIVVHVLVALALVVIILIQHGKGADAGAAFGSGASSTVFGSQGSSSFFSRLTGVLATVFFITSLTLFWININTAETSSVTETVAPAAIEQPAQDQTGDVPVMPGSGDDTAIPDVPSVPAQQAPAADTSGKPGDVPAIPE